MDPTLGTPTTTILPTLTPLPPGPLPWDGFEALCWALAGILLAGMAAYALFMAWRWRGRYGTTEEFVTARGAVPMWRVAWSLFAGSVGAWVISSPSSYAAAAGLVGLFSYSFASGLPVIMIAFAGPVIERSMPRAMSLSEFMGWRYGVVAQIGVTCLTILNMGIVMLAEYVTIGTLFKVYVGSLAYPIVITVGLLTLLYTTVGGLLVSIATDQVQGIASFLLIFVIAVYLGVTFDLPLPPTMEERVSGDTEVGLSSIYVMPVSMFSSAVFTESLWQRAFAAESKAKLRWASVIAAAAITIMVFVSGLCGWLAAWAAPDVVFAANPNLYMFYGLKDSINATTGTVNNGLGVVVLMMAVIMNEGTIDSLQNGLLASFTSFAALGIRQYRRMHPGRLPEDYQLPLWVTRLLVVLINIPLIVLGSFGASDDWSILDLFIICNMLTCIIAVPVMCGLIRRLQPYFGGVSFVFTWAVAFICPSLYGIFKECWHSELVFDPMMFLWVCVPSDTAGGAAAGMAFTWYRNGYRWQYFLLAVGCSIGAMLLCIVANVALRRCGVHHIDVPGFIPLLREDPAPKDPDMEICEKDGSSGLPTDPLENENDSFSYLDWAGPHDADPVPTATPAHSLAGPPEAETPVPEVYIY